MKVIVKKLFLGKYVSIRDYLVEQAEKKFENILVVHDGKSMLIEHKNLKEGKVDPKQQFSKYDKKAYHLVDFEWKPEKEPEKDENQEVLFATEVGDN